MKKPLTWHLHLHHVFHDGFVELHRAEYRGLTIERSTTRATRLYGTYYCESVRHPRNGNTIAFTSEAAICRAIDRILAAGARAYGTSTTFATGRAAMRRHQAAPR